jgi:PAS domain S-box-containing protein
MAIDKESTDNTNDLRTKAEEKVAVQASTNGSLEDQDVKRLFHELQIHQVELEMQNEDLIRTKHDLEATRDSYFELYDLAPVGYLTINKDGLIQRANLTAVTMLGVERDALINKPIQKFIFCDDVDSYYLQSRSAVEASEDFKLELRFVKCDGSPFWVILRATLQNDNEFWLAFSDISDRKQLVQTLRQAKETLEEQVVTRTEELATAIVSLQQEITERKRAAMALKESEYFFKESQRAASIGSYCCNFVGSLWDSSEVLDTTFGIDREYKSLWDSSEVLDTIFGIDREYNRNIPGWLDIVHPDDRQMMDQYLREEVISKRKNFSKEYRIVRKNDGETRWVFGLGEVTYDSNIAQSMIGTIQDITERKQSEHQMVSLTQRLQIATSSANLGVWDWNICEKKMEWDDRMFEIYGITRDTFSNTIDAWMNGLHPEDRETAIAECQAAINGERVFDTVFRALHPDGTVKHLKANGIVVMGEDGSAKRMIGVNADITEQVQTDLEKTKLEKQIHLSQKMEAIGQLAGGVAHDFNNKLMVILGNVELVKMDIHNSDKVLNYMSEIHRAAEQSSEITCRLLAFSRQQVVTPQVLDANEIIADSLKSLSRLIGEHISILFEPYGHLWNIRMDPVQLDQIVMNLAINARDAMPDGGSIAIETRNITYSINSCSSIDAASGDYVMLSFSDSGTGMNKETIDRIFEPFFTTKEVGKGTGLGLATIFGIVRQNNGFIDVTSHVGYGTEFKIHIPRFNEPTKETVKIAETLCTGSSTILLVEDEDAVMSVTSQFLLEIGYIVHEAATPRAALELARDLSIHIDLVLTDFLMPEMNGRVMMEQILELRPQLLCIYASGFTTEHVLLTEDAHFIQKPYDLIKLSGYLKRIHSNEQEQ